MSVKNLWLVIALGVATPFVLAPPSAIAQEDDDTLSDEGSEDTDVVYKNDQVINFEGLDVQGEIKKPAGAYLLDRKKSNFSPLITFEQNWDEEAVESLDQKK